jgi:beta-N-acetylhexosaminidase
MVRFRLQFLLFLVLGLVVLPGCGEKDPPTQPAPLMTSEVADRLWADSVLAKLTLPQKAAQLVLVEGIVLDDSVMQTQFSDLLGRNRFGGVVIADGQRDTLREQVHAWKEASELPLWVALDAGPIWSASQNWPSLLTLGTVASDSLARLWGKALGAETQFLGGNICLISGGKVGESGAWVRDALGVVPKHVTRLSQALATGLREGGVQPCFRPLMDVEDLKSDSTNRIPSVDDDLMQLNVGKGNPLQKLLVSDPSLWLQASNAVFSAIDKLPIGHSKRAITYFLREKLRFEGIVVSPRGADAGSLVAGADLIVAPKDPIAVVKEIVALVDGGSQTITWLDEKVRKVLKAKAAQGLSDQSTEPKFAFDPSRRLLQLDRAMAKSTLVVLRDTKGRLPFGANITQAKVATLALGAASKSELQVAMDAYAAVDHYLMGTKIDSLALERQMTQLKRYEYVVVSLHGNLVKDQPNGRFSPELIRFLKKLDRSNKLVVVNFAGQASLQDLDGLSCLAFVSEDRDRNANLAGQALFGAFPVTTLLPDNISAAFPAGSGVVLNKKLRLEYTEPEDLGIDPRAMLRIDSFVDNAVKMGVFPGCQVFAAKDGKVFLHKGYGYHDYERSQRVRTADLYDIASVSKIAATTLMAMAAFDVDTLKLNQPLKYFIPELDSAFVTIKDITPQQLLTHSSGLPAGIILNKYYKMIFAVDSIRNRIYSAKPDSLHSLRIAEDLYLAQAYQDTVWDKVRRMRLNPPEYEYSDLSMYLMKALLERILGSRLDRYVDSAFYHPMGLRRIGYHPLDRFEKEEIVPTEQDRHWRKQILRGDVHDPTVAFLGGIGGPAGIFSNSADLATLMQMIVNGGQYGGKQYFDPETVKLFTSRQDGSRRGLGFDMQLPVPQCDKGYCCVSANPGTFGHFGYTGTCAWADPQNKIVYVFLSNRVYPDDANKKINAYRIRQGVQQLIYDALGLGLTPTEGFMAEEEDCYIEGA